MRFVSVWVHRTMFSTPAECDYELHSRWNGRIRNYTPLPGKTIVRGMQRSVEQDGDYVVLHLEVDD